MPTLSQLQLTEKQLTQQLGEFLSSLDELELSPEQEQEQIQKFFAEFLKNEQDQKEKVNASVWYLTYLDRDAKYYREQARRMETQARVIENRANSFKDHLAYIIAINCDDGKYPTKDFPKLALRNNPESVQIDNNYQGEIPEKFLKARDIEDMVSISLVKEALKAGAELSFARLVRKGKSLIGLK